MNEIAQRDETFEFEFATQRAANLVEYGKRWSVQQLRHCMRFAETFPDAEIVSTLWREFSWSQTTPPRNLLEKKLLAAIKIARERSA